MVIVNSPVKDYSQVGLGTGAFDAIVGDKG